ncbi:MAG: hypothetical protein MSC31_17615 [Solirubrobacteraceae bacterium MAG38_C4-C5]|nr:hypothetical protein [Candidatus Siliceabacter maunaloa]
MGSADAHGVDYTAGTEVLHHEDVIERQEERRVAEATERYHPPLANAEQHRTDHAEQAEDHGRDLFVLAEEAADVDEALAAETGRRGPHPVIYALVVLALGLVTWPTDATVAAVLPLPPLAQLVVALGVGIVLIFAAHKGGHFLFEVTEGWAVRKERPAQFRRDVAMLVLYVIGPLGLMLTFGAVRGDGLDELAALTGGLALDNTTVNVALTCLQVLVFIIAVAFALAWAEGTPRRQLRGDLRKLRRRMKREQKKVDLHEKAVANAEVTLGLLREELDKEIAAVHAVHAERLEHFREARRRRSAQVQLRQRRIAKLARRSEPPPPSEMVYPGRPIAPPADIETEAGTNGRAR